jgi:hypothetical protein
MTTSPPPKTSQNNIPLIRASELAQYGFCQRAWWLGAVKKLRPVNRSALERGTRFHSRHAHSVRTAGHWHRLGLILLGGGSFLLVLTVVFSILS